MIEWIIGFVGQYGYSGIAILMLLENVFPPIPSELIMPFAGFVAARGELHPVGVVLAGTLGSVAGTLPWYWAGRRLGSARIRGWASEHGRWLAVSAGDIARSERWFKRHGGAAVLLGRLVPTVRSVISAPAGITKMPLARFLFWTLLGTAIWTSVLAGAGYVLEHQYEAISDWLDPVGIAVFALAVLSYLYRVVTFKRHP